MANRQRYTVEGTVTVHVDASILADSEQDAREKVIGAVDAATVKVTDRASYSYINIEISGPMGNENPDVSLDVWQEDA